MSIIQIDKNIPMPPSGRGRKQKYPWGEMGIGDSFLTRGITLESARSFASREGKLRKRKFRAARVDGGIRIWRTM